MICKKDLVLFIFPHTTCFGYLLEWGDSNKYPKHMLLEVLMQYFLHNISLTVTSWAKFSWYSNNEYCRCIECRYKEGWLICEAPHSLSDQRIRWYYSKVSNDFRKRTEKALIECTDWPRRSLFKHGFMKLDTTGWFSGICAKGHTVFDFVFAILHAGLAEWSAFIR